MRAVAASTGLIFTNRNMMVFALGLMAAWLALMPSTPAQAALFSFMLAALAYEFLISRHPLQRIEVAREHLPRVFEDDTVEVTLTVSSQRPLAMQMVLLEDQFLASLDPHQRHLLPWLARGWQVRLRYLRAAERHHGLYLMGPVRLATSDPLGIFHAVGEVPTITRLTVYPRADPLPDYRLPGPRALPGSSLDLLPRLGQGEEILAIREYQRGDPPSRIHWRTSARRGRLHTLQLNQPIQAELLVLLDLTRLGRYGLGNEATPRLAVTAAVAVLNRGFQARHRVGLGCVQRDMTLIPTGAGLAHLHLLLDRLVVLEPLGDADFWTLALPPARLLRPGSRAVFIVTAARTPPAVAEPLRQLTATGIGVDVVLIDQREFMRIYREQEGAPLEEERRLDLLRQGLRQAGARVFGLNRHDQNLAAAISAEQLRQAALRAR